MEPGQSKMPHTSLKAPSPSKADSKSNSAIKHQERDSFEPAQEYTNTLFSKVVHRGNIGNTLQEITMSTPLSPVEQETSLQVEDVFNDSQLVNNRMAIEGGNHGSKAPVTTTLNSDRISMLPEIQPAEQPGDGDSSENVVSDLGSPSNANAPEKHFGSDQAKPVQATTYDMHKLNQKEERKNGSKPPSTFAKALANKKQSSLENNND